MLIDIVSRNNDQQSIAVLHSATVKLVSREISSRLHNEVARREPTAAAAVTWIVRRLSTACGDARLQSSAIQCHTTLLVPSERAGVVAELHLHRFCMHVLDLRVE